MKASTVAAGAGGFVGVPIAAGLVTVGSTYVAPAANVAPRALAIDALAAVGAIVAARRVSSPAARAALYAGAAGAAGAALLWWRFLGVASRTPAPSPSPPAPGAWLAVNGSPIRLERGRRYRGAIDLPGWPVSAAISADAAAERARELGFSEVVATKDRPAGWPDVEDADLWVEGTWNGADGETLERPDRLVGAWRLG